MSTTTKPTDKTNNPYAAPVLDSIKKILDRQADQDALHEVMTSYSMALLAFIHANDAENAFALVDYACGINPDEVPIPDSIKAMFGGEASKTRHPVI